MPGRRRPKLLGKGWAALSNPIPSDIASALKELHIDVLKEVGDELVALCPMHLVRTGKIDRRPSWSVNRVNGAFNCFSCGYAGPFAKLVADMLDTERDVAVLWISERGGVEAVRRYLERDEPVMPTTLPAINEASLALMDLPPKSEVARRRLTFDAIQHHGVLWDPRPTKRCWILPIREPFTNKLLGWQEKNDRFFRNRPASVTKSKTLFGLDVFDADTTAILVESPLDVVRLSSVGIPGGLASYGASVSETQMNLIHECTDTVIVAMDNPLLDPAGRRASEDLRQKWLGQGLTVRFLNYNGMKVKDIGDMEDSQIRYAVSHAVPSVFARFA